MRDRFLEQRINIEFCAKLGMNTSDSCAILSETCGGRICEKFQCFSVAKNGSKTARMSKSHMKTLLITFFDIKGTVHFEFIPQDQTVN